MNSRLQDERAVSFPVARANGHQVQEAVSDAERAGDCLVDEDLEATRQGGQADSEDLPGIRQVGDRKRWGDAGG